MKASGNISGFEWDAHNKDKNLIAHGVTNEECEEAFFDPDKKILEDTIHFTARPEQAGTKTI